MTIIGAPQQAARHSSSRLRKMRPSAVDSPSLQPSFFSACATRSSAPLSQQLMLVQKATLLRPTGCGLEHRVEGRDLVGPHRRQAEVLRDGGDQLVGQPAVVLFLRGMQALQHAPSACGRAGTWPPSGRCARAWRPTARPSGRRCARSKLPVALIGRLLIGRSRRTRRRRCRSSRPRRPACGRARSRPSTTGARSPARAACTRNGLLAPSETR